MVIPSPVKGFALLIIMLSLLPLAAGGVNAQSPGPPAVPEQSPGYDEAEAYAIDGMIMCPVCPAETIDQAQVPIARQMRALVREKLAQGATRQEILDFFAQRYGPAILASPPKSGFNLVAWIFPLVGVAAALAAGLLVLRSMSARRVDQTATGPQVTGPADGREPDGREPDGRVPHDLVPHDLVSHDLVSPDLDPDDLEPYLAMVDRELALRRNLPVNRQVGSDGDTSESPVGSV